MDGMTMNTGRHTQGLKTTTFVNPDMIDELYTDSFCYRAHCYAQNC